MVQRIQSLLKEEILFLRYDEQTLDGLVLINGCPRACAAKNLNRSKVSYCSIFQESDFELLIQWLRALNEKGDF